MTIAVMDHGNFSSRITCTQRAAKQTKVEGRKICQRNGHQERIDIKS